MITLVIFLCAVLIHPTTKGLLRDTSSDFQLFPKVPIATQIPLYKGTFNTVNLYDL